MCENPLIMPIIIGYTCNIFFISMHTVIGVCYYMKTSSVYLVQILSSEIDLKVCYTNQLLALDQHCPDGLWWFYAKKPNKTKQPKTLW